MGQYWQIVAPELEERIQFGFGVKLGEVLFDGSPNSMIIHIAIPTAQRIEAKLSPMPLAFPKNSSPLVNLPTEILEYIVSLLPMDSLATLALCSQRLFYICRNRLVKLRMAECGRLAGTSLVCVGDYLAAGDYPPGIDWKSKMEELGKMYRDDDYSDSEDEQQEMPNIFLIADEYFSIIEQPCRHSLFEYMTNDQYFGFLKSFSKLPPANQEEDMDFFMRPNPRQFYVSGPDWILRNLTTKEYVRKSVLGNGTNDGPFNSRGVGLGQALLSRICWSSDPSTSMSWDGIHRGIWAGHRFDITQIEAVEGEAGWKDVSESMYDELVSIWKSEYGPDWEKEWRGERY